MKQEEDSFDGLVSKPPKDKRSRSSNFTSEEEDVLISLVERYSHIVENKKTNAESWQQKIETWDKISLEFGTQCGTVRSSKTLKHKYENMKRKAKIAINNDRREFYKTGGKVCDNYKRIIALSGKSTTGLYNEIDSDMSEKSNEDNFIEINFKQDESEGDMVQEDPIHQYSEEYYNKSNSWSNWNPEKFETKKAEELNFNKRIFAKKDEEVLAKQAIFFENEERRAEERHKLQISELNLKNELLQLEIALKKLEIEKIIIKHGNN